MKIAVSCAISNSHVLLLDHLIKSILKHNPDFNYDWHLFCRKGDSTYRYSLTDSRREHLLSLYPNFIFTEVDLDKYAKYNKDAAIYYSIEMFNLREYDKVIYWGADMLCLKSLDELFEYAKTVEGVSMPIEMRRPNTFNNGSMVVDKSYLNDKTYKDLLTFEYWNPIYKEFYGHDQKIYNAYFKNKIQKAPQKFNTLVSEVGFLRFADILLLHYMYKPTQEASRRRLSPEHIKLWEQYDNPKGRYFDIC